MGNMKSFYVSACFLAILYAAGSAKSGCLEREKALAFLEAAEEFLTKAEDSYASYKEDLKTTDQSGCRGKKPLAYIEISKKLISDVRGNFPTCTGPELIVPHVKPRDCSEILASGHNQSGVYTIWLKESNAKGCHLQVFCDMERDGGGWMVIQRRGKYPVQQNFYQDWKNYRNGFGNITEEFWLGNENIRVLCQKGCKIRFDLLDINSQETYAVYQDFSLSEGSYTIQIGGYSGNAGDSMAPHNNYDFSTKDKGNTDRARNDQSGWWPGNGEHTNLNGIYQPGGDSIQVVYWYKWHKQQNLAAVEIKVKSK